MKRLTLLISALVGALILGATTVQAEDVAPANMDSVLLASPLMGWIRNEVTVDGPPGMPAQTLTDESEEDGLFLMYANPRLVFNNTFFNTDVNDTTVWGNVTTLNIYGNPAAAVTWHLGGSYLWHDIDGETVDVTVEEPLAKAGVLVRVRALHLSINPYVGYAWQQVETTVDTPRMTLKETEHTGSMVYGISAYWQWRMMYANAKYYLEDNDDRDELNNVFRLWGCAMFSKQVGLLGRFEYSEQFSTKDTSVLVGPVFVF